MRQSRPNEKQNFDFSLSTTRSKSSKNTETDNNLKSTSSKRTQPEHLILGSFSIGICKTSIQTGEKILQRIFFKLIFYQSTKAKNLAYTYKFHLKNAQITLTKKPKVIALKVTVLHFCIVIID